MSSNVNGVYVLSSDHINYVSGGAAPPEEETVIDRIWNTIKQLIEPSEQQRQVNIMEKAGYDCIQQSNDTYVCYNEDRTRRDVIGPQGGGTSSPYSNPRGSN